MDGIIYFNGLKPESVGLIVDKFIFEMENQLRAKKIEISVTSEAKAWLAQIGYDVKLGARPLARIVDEKIKKPLSKEILFGKLEKGGKVEISLSTSDQLHDQELVFSYH